MSGVHRLIYTSRSATALGPDPAAAGTVADILAASRRNNGRRGVTGALLVGGRSFVQVLEGAHAAVEATFERIRSDPRHGDIGLLQREAVAERIFAGWDMACVNRSERGDTLLKTVSRQTAQPFSAIEGERFCATLLAILRADEAASASPPAAAARPVPPPSLPSSGSDVPAAVLRGLLDEERDRTTALRRELDDARVALAQVRSAVDATERHRDIWADRGRQLRTELTRLRETLGAARAECGEARERLTACEAERDRLRVHRDIWAERTRSLAGALCREPAAAGDDARRDATNERPSFGVVPA